MIDVAEQILITCDRKVRGKACGEPAKTYTVARFDTEVWDIDLCDEHSFWQQVVDEGRVHKQAGGRRTAAQATRPWIPNRGNA